MASMRARYLSTSARDEYFPALKKVLDERNILLVDDEIQMGFYRAGKFWAIENFNVEPDIIVFGKALTNGLNPLSGLWAREELITPEIFPPGSTHSTFSSNTLGTAVALETLKMLEEEDYEKLVNEKGAYFLAGLRELRSRHQDVIGDVDGAKHVFGATAKCIIITSCDSASACNYSCRWSRSWLAWWR